MFWNYPVPVMFYPIAGIIFILLLLPRVVDTLLKSRLTWMLLAIIAIVGMLLIPSENHLLGDGITHLSSPDRVFAPTEPLDVLLHFLVGKLTGSMIAGYRIIALVAGLFYLYGLCLVASFGQTPLEKGIIAGAFTTTATIQFYFGYVESYTLLNLFILFYIYFAWRDLKQENHSHWPLLFFVLAVLSHFSGIVLLPSLIYLYRGNLKRYFIYLVVTLVALGAVVAWKTQFGIIMVPPVANAFSSYSLFSTAHLLDLLRELLLVSPVFFLAVFGRRKGGLVVFIMLALAGALLFTILVDPKIGAFRDWDLLAIFALPLAGLIALRAPRSRLTLAVLALILVLRIIPWLLFNSSLQTEFAKKVVNSDLHYTQEYDNGRRLASWGVFLKEIGDYKGAETVFLKRLRYQPDDFRTLTMLVPTQFQLGKYAEAHKSCLQGLKLQPNDINFLYKGIYTAFRINELDAALRLWAASPPAFRDNPSVLRLYAGIIAVRGQHEQAVEIINRFPLVDTESYLPYILAKSCMVVGDYAQARKLIEQALKLDPDNTEYRTVLDLLSVRQAAP